MVHGPFQFLSETIGRNKAIVRGSYPPNPQQGIPAVTVNRKPASFPICFLHVKFISQGSTIKCDLNNNSNHVSAADGGGGHRTLSSLCSNQSFALRLIKKIPHQVLIHSSNLADLATYPWYSLTNCKWFSPLIIPPKLFPLKRPSIPASIILIPSMW